MKRVTAAAVQAGSILFDTPRTMEKLADLAADAAASGTGLIVFPEAFVGGYPKGHDFGARVGSRSPEGRDWFARYHASAITVPGPETERMGEIAQANNAEMVVGVIERDGGTLYCTALGFRRDGALAGARRKLMPTAMERLVWGFGDGSTLNAWDLEAGRTSATICWENYMPAMRMNWYAQNVEIYTAPTVDDRESWPVMMRAAAMEGRCFVVSACQYLTRADCPPDYEPDSGDPLIRGASCIVAPMGEMLAGPVFGEAAILTAELDPALIARGKYDFDAAGHYARPDIFELKVDRRRKPAVSDA